MYLPSDKKFKMTRELDNGSCDIRGSILNAINDDAYVVSLPKMEADETCGSQVWRYLVDRPKSTVREHDAALFLLCALNHAN